MIDIKFLRENPDAVRENIKKKFQDAKLPLVDEVIEYDAKSRAAQKEADAIRAEKKKISKQIGVLMKQGKKEEAEEIKRQVADNSRIDELDAVKREADEIVKKDMMLIPQIIDLLYHTAQAFNGTGSCQIIHTGMRTNTMSHDPIRTQPFTCHHALTGFCRFKAQAVIGIFQGIINHSFALSGADLFITVKDRRDPPIFNGICCKMP